MTTAAPATTDKLQRAIRAAIRFRSYALAAGFAGRCNTVTGVLLGDDGRFWVPVCGADYDRLLKAGYEAA